MDIVKNILTQPSKERAQSELAKVNLTLREERVAELIYFDGLTLEQTAEVMDASVSSISNWKKKVHGKCKAVFEDV